ncbi:amidohydrolase family protein [Luteimonas fraxinea]|uniref:Amidohydrolase family protein n=1 Tax=Luteimonas fraxinea TaxID=2901869 RepID=A0ABS8U9S6_9GAMM|nr:amidohydrolase family protein [Luteimonas fraxinea]MCD9095657.1 amidohydrolase family protein [Luteimonas fraxinea]MCD9124239.1 amidohydrolase family protein [Luteimonas fraxinea]UHH11151.1 amidohydrolase family protein [Luteimonas fraxinea]
MTNRREFLRRSGGIMTAGAALGFLPLHAQAQAADAASVAEIAHDHYLLTDVRLETGFVRDGDVVVGTETALHTLEIEGGRIVAIHDAPVGSLPRYSAHGLLALPPMRDMHIHLDKTFYGGPWQAPRPRKGKTIMDMIAYEETLLPQLLPTSQARAEALIVLLLSNGTTTARSHCNIDPVSGLRSLEHLNRALADRQASFDCEIVAFPQHGLLHSKVDGLMRESMALGVTHVGGLDPTNVDGAMEASLDAMFQIALDHDKGVDIHLHESGPSGVAALRYMVETVEANAPLQSRVTFSHAFALATLDAGELVELGGRMAAQGIDVASTVPIGRSVMPLQALRDMGVRVMSGTDSVIDHWSPFGTGDMIDKANLYAQLYAGSDEHSLSRSLWIATGDVLPLDDAGARAWPKTGDAAAFVLAEASCSAEVVARCSPRRATFHEGRLVSGGIDAA